MEISKELIQERYDALLSGAVTRESVSEWAFTLREANDIGQLEFNPERDRLELMQQIIFLEGIDLKVTPNEYLHNDEDILRERPQS